MSAVSPFVGTTKPLGLPAAEYPSVYVFALDSIALVFRARPRSRYSSIRAVGTHTVFPINSRALDRIERVRLFHLVISNIS